MNKNLKRKRRIYYFGIVAEYVAIVFLFLKGYRILYRRYKTKAGEIDLIAVRGDVIVAVEVKGRHDALSYETVLSERQKRRVANAAKMFLSGNPRYNEGYAVRFDLVFVFGMLGVKHVVSAWEENAF